MKEVESLRERIRALKTERLEVVSQPLSRGTVQRVIGHVVEQAQRQGERALSIALARAAAGQSFAPLTVRAVAGVDRSAGVAHVSLDLSALLVVLTGPARVTEILTQAGANLPEGLDPPERLLRLGEIDAELERLERAEEVRLCELENQGVHVLRRPDARPELVLAT